MGPWQLADCQLEERMILPRKLVWISLIFLGMLSLGGACQQQIRSQTVVDSDGFRQRIADYLTGLNKAVSQVEVEEITPLEDSSLLTVKLSYVSGQSKQSTELFVTEDGRHLILGQVWNLELTPQEARWRQLSRVGEENLAKIDLVDRPARGNPDAGVVVVEYSDYQCPYCATAYSGLETRLLEKYGDRIRFVFKHLPLTSIHPWALKAALAATCGYLQDPEAFWEIHSRLFENQKAITVENLREKVEGFAIEANLNQERFIECFDKESTRSVVMSDVSEAAQLKITSTPTFLLNGAPFRGAPDFDEFSGFIDMALKEASSR